MIIENRGQLRILIPNEGNVLFKKMKITVENILIKYF